MKQEFWLPQLEALLNINNAEFIKRFVAIAEEEQEYFAVLQKWILESQQLLLQQKNANLTTNQPVTGQVVVPLSHVLMGEGSGERALFSYHRPKPSPLTPLPEYRERGTDLLLNQPLVNAYLDVGLQALDLLNAWLNDQIQQNKTFSIKQFYLAWLNCSEQVYLQLLNTPTFQQNWAAWINSFLSNSQSLDSSP